ncbi:TIGR02221 family CRISPR-associated protein [Aggregatilineales bacterium SYSU G02658]
MQLASIIFEEREVTKILLAGIGTGRYESTAYDFGGGQLITSRFFSSALAQYIKPDLMLIMLTKEAKEHDNWKYPETGLEAELIKHNLRYEPVDILTGQNEDELWKIFDAIVQAVPAGSQVHLDVTHAFRTLSIIFLGSLSYLRATKQVTVEGIHYGAFEARKKDEKSTEDAAPAPVFDLTAFLSLIEWSYAAQAFDKTGDVSLLGRLLEERQNQLHKLDTKPKDLPRKIQSVGKRLQDQARALDLVRPDEVMTISDVLISEIEKASEEIPEWAKPFSVVLDQVKQQAEKFALKDPSQADVSEYLQRQLAICRWYCDRKRYFAASVLQRELLVSWFMHQQKTGIQDIQTSKEKREKAEKLLNSVYDVFKDFKQAGIQINGVDVFGLWHEIREARNNLAHCSMGRPYDSRMRTKTSIDNVIEIQEQLDKLIGNAKAEKAEGEAS